MPLPVFPTLTGISFPVTRSPMWSNLHQEAASGQDNPIGLWTFPKWKYQVPFDMLRSDNVNLEWQNLLNLYNAVNGTRLPFQFNDLDDNTVTDQLFGTGDGSTTAFALVRTMPGTAGFVEPVFAPTITNIKDNGTPTVLYTLGTQGLVTFNSAPVAGHTLTWTGTYNWLCRFDDDSIDLEKFANLFWEAKKITFTTIKTQSK